MWTIEYTAAPPPENKQCDIQIEQSEAEALEQARKFIASGLIVNAIKAPGGTVAYTQDQIYARYHGFNAEAVKNAEMKLPRNWRRD
jgi:hypothetical protein